LNTALLTSENPLRVKLSTLDDSEALLVLPDKQTFKVSRKYLPKGAKKGDILYLDLVSEKQLNFSKQETARAVLDEILS